MKDILNLIRWKNLLIIALVQLLIKYALLEPFGVQTSLDSLGISLLILATVCIAAAGNIINDIYDVETDAINKPNKCIVGKSISEKTAYNLFIGFNVIGVAIGFYISHLVGKSAFFTLFVIISALLYVYASYLKGILIVGNIIISVLVAFSVLIVGIFELIPPLTPENRDIQLSIFKVVFRYSVLAFMINLLREFVKDIEDIDGDNKVGLRTLPVVIGRERATIVLFVLSFIPLIIITYYTINKLYTNLTAVVYFLTCIIGPLIYISIKSFNAKTKKEYQHISIILKLVIITGILSLLLYL